jgi:hypothetical protein
VRLPHHPQSVTADLLPLLLAGGVFCEAEADTLGQFHELLTALRHARLLGIGEVLRPDPSPPAGGHALVETILDQLIVHLQRVSHLLLLQVLKQLRLLVIRDFVERVGHYRSNGSLSLNLFAEALKC